MVSSTETDAETVADLPDDITQAVADAVGSKAWQDIVSVRIEQITKYNHTPDQDDLEPMSELVRRSIRKLEQAKDNLSLGGWDYLDAARKRLVTTAAMLVAQIDRIDRKLADRENREWR